MKTDIRCKSCGSTEEILDEGGMCKDCRRDYINKPEPYDYPNERE